MKNKQLRPYLLLWGTQAFSALGSGMTSYALVLWLYLRSGSALGTALLSVCSYAPYVVMSIFAGALSDRWNKKRTMLVCDLLAALSTVAVFLLIRADVLCAWHLYILNALNGLMNTIQQPASEVAATLLVPKDYYQKTSGLRSFSQSLNSILTPILATALFAFGGIEVVIAVDLATFACAFLTLLLFIRIPEGGKPAQKPEALLTAARQGDRVAQEDPSDFHPDRIPRVHQLGGVRIRRGSSRYDPVQTQRRGNGAGNCQHLRRYRDAGGQSAGHRSPRAEGSGQGHLVYPAFLHEQ